MLSDRDYMRDQGRGAPWSMTTRIVVVLAGAFALQCVNDVYFRLSVVRFLPLVGSDVARGMVWQLFTFQLLHGSFFHLAFNLMTFAWVGRFVEQVMGGRRMLAAMVGTGVVGGLAHVALALAFPLHFGYSVVGASAGVSGLLAIFCLVQPDAEILLFAMLPLRASAFFWLSVALSLFFTVVPTPGEMGVAHAAHLGGLAAGYAWVKMGWHDDYVTPPWEGLWRRLSLGWRSRGRSAPRRPAGGSWSAEPAAPPVAPADFMATQVDPILDKIAAHGIHSLTERERKTLEAARARMGKS